MNIFYLFRYHKWAFSSLSLLKNWLFFNAFLVLVYTLFPLRLIHNLTWSLSYFIWLLLTVPRFLVLSRSSFNFLLFSLNLLYQTLWFLTFFLHFLDTDRNQFNIALFTYTIIFFIFLITFNILGLALIIYLCWLLLFSFQIFFFFFNTSIFSIIDIFFFLIFLLTLHINFLIYTLLNL